MVMNSSGHIITNGQLIDSDTLEAYIAIWDTQTWLMPGICSLGFVTNFLSILVFLQTSLRRLSFSVYLAAKAISDFLFLSTVFIIWLSRLEIEVFHTTGVCQIVVFLSYLTAFISIWLAVTLTVENLLCVAKPWYVQRTCNAVSATTITIIIVIIGILLYHFSLWNNGVRLIPTDDKKQTNLTFGSENKMVDKMHSFNDSVIENGKGEYNSKFHTNFLEIKNGTKDSTSGKSTLDVSDTNFVEMCIQLDEFNQFIVAITYIDTVMTLFLPVLILAVTNAVIVVLAVRTTRRRSRMNEHKRQYQLPGTHLSHPRKSSASLETQASRFLFAVSMTTLLFHLPSHMVRLKSMVFSVTTMNILLQRVFETLYYTHYAIGFFVYLVFGDNFRRVFCELVSRKTR